MLPFEPEPEITLRSRYPEAVSMTLDARTARPGKLRRHVFDFYSGLRLIISRETSDGKSVYLHFSGSMHPPALQSRSEFASLIVGSVNGIRGMNLQGRCSVTEADDGVIHVFYTEGQPAGPLRLEKA